VLVEEARAAAVDWVRRQAGPNLLGAFLTGSAAVAGGGEDLPATSDVDVIMVTAGSAPAKIGKLWHSGVLLDVSSMSADDLDATTVATTSYLAPFVARGRIVHDPFGHLAALRSRVVALVDRPEWVRRRVAEVRGRITSGLDAADPTAPLAQQVLGWVFPASLPAVQLLVAAGRPPTVRQRYLRCRELLCDLDRLDPYERLLGILGCGDVGSTRVDHHLANLADTLRVTAAHARTPFPFSGDLRPDTWHVTLDGSAELVVAGRHREAVWWLLATYARCVTVLAVDAPSRVTAEHQRALAGAAEELLGFRAGDGPVRAGSVRNLLVEVDALAEDLLVGGAR
jgi:hypothetical protein